MAGAYTGGLLGGHMPGQLLLIAFALMMLATAVAMLRGRRGREPEPAHAELPVGRVLLDGVVVGLVTGLVGAGGGFLVVPPWPCSAACRCPSRSAPRCWSSP